MRHFALSPYFAMLLGLLASCGWSTESPEVPCMLEASKQLAEHPVLQRELSLFNEQKIDPMLLEAKWLGLSHDSAEILKIINNPASPLIQEFITQYSIQGEGFLIGLNGGLVAATNKTTDYFQGDEAQFTETLKLPKGEIWVEKDVADESASSLLVKIAVPVFSSSKVSGVLVIGLDEFVVDFYGDCEKSGGHLPVPPAH